MKKVVNVAVDIETTSLQENAAIMSIAAVPFDVNGADTGFPDFYEVIDLSSCVMDGMHFDMKTVEFWKKQSDEAKIAILSNSKVSIREALESFVNYIDKIQRSENVEVRIWAQGSDFDIPILRNAIRNILKIKDIPWKHTQIRDSRTWILETIELIHGPLDNPYSALSQNESWVKHAALSDAKQLANNVSEVYNMLIEKLK